VSLNRSAMLAAIDSHSLTLADPTIAELGVACLFMSQLSEIHVRGAKPDALEKATVVSWTQDASVGGLPKLRGSSMQSESASEKYLFLHLPFVTAAWMTAAWGTWGPEFSSRYCQLYTRSHTLPWTGMGSPQETAERSQECSSISLAYFG
jgi:hypothetical protein